MAWILILTTTPNLKFAQTLSKNLVKTKLAACVSVKPGIVSFYRWKGRVEKVRECLLLIKSRKDRFQKIKKAICNQHPYEIPEVISLPISQGSSEYLSWMKSSIK